MEKIYQALLQKFDADMDEGLKNKQIAFLLTQEPTKAIDALYTKYTGTLPSEESKLFLYNKAIELIPPKEEKIKPSNFRRAINAFKRIGSSIADDFQRDEAARRIQNHDTQITKIKNTPDSINSFRVGGRYSVREGYTIGGENVNREKAIKYYEDLIEKDSKIFRENFIEAKEMQEYLDKYERINIFDDDGDGKFELWDDFNLTVDKGTGVIAEQIPQMFSALASFGFTTYTQEGGAVATELIDRVAAEEMGLTYEAFQNLPKEQQANAVLNAIQDGKTVDALNEANRVGIQNAAFDYASNLFLVGKATKFVPKTALRGLLKGKVNKDARDYLTGLGYSQLAELVVENAQEINSALALDNPITAKLIAETTAQTLIGTSGTQISIGASTFAVRETIAELTALRDPESLRAIANAMKTEVNKSNRTQAEKDQILRDIDVAENVANNSNYKYLSYEGRKKMFELQIEKANAQQNLSTLEEEFKTNKSISIEAKIENEKNRIESYNNQLAKTIYLENFHTTGKNLLAYINADKTGFFANKQGIMRATRAELKAWLEQNRPDLLDDPNVIDMLEGTVNEAGMRIYTPGVMRGDLALFVEENVDNNIFKTKGIATSANVVHHEVFHFIFESYGKKEKAEIIKQLDLAFSESTDVFMQKAYEDLKERLSVYGKFDITNENIINEYLSGLSDVLSPLTALQNIQQGDMFNRFGEVFAKEFSKKLKNIPIEINGENALELILRYNSFAGVKPASQSTLLDAAGKVVQATKTKGKVDVEDKTLPSIEADLSSEQIQSSQNALDQYITEDIKTQDDFQNSDAARAGIYTEIEVNLVIDPVINSIIQRDENTSGLSSEIQEDIKRKVREKITERVFKNFNPTLDGNKRSVFSYIYGDGKSKGLGGIAFRAFQDVKLEYVKKPKGQSIETDAGTTIDILDETSTDIESMIDAKILSENIENTSNSKIQDEVPILTEDDIKDLQEFADEIFGEDQAFDPNDPDFRKNIKTLFENAVMPKIRAAAGNFKTFYNNYIETLFDPNKKLLSIQYLYQAERSLEDKNFAKFNKRLTTQEEIRKARDEKNAFVENEAQGVDLYDRLEFNQEATDNYYEPDNTKPSSTIRARRNKLLAEYGKEVLFNLSPKAIKQSPLSTEDKATAARKIERTLASRAFAFEMGLKDIYYNVADDTKRYSDGIIKFLPFLDKYPGLLNIGIVTSGLEMGGYINKQQIQEIKQRLLKGSDNWVGKKNFSYGKSATRKQALIDSEKNYYKGAPISQKNLKTRTLNWLMEATNRYVNAGIHLWTAINQFINEPNITKAERKERILTMIHFMVNSYKDKSHLHRRMAKLIGFDVVAAANNEQMVMEHAMQSARAWKELIRGSANKEVKFEILLNQVLKNYVLIGLSKKDADKVDKTSYYDKKEGKTKFYKDGMGYEWNLWESSWTERYFNSLVAKNDGGVTLKNLKTLQGVQFSKQYNIKKDGSPITLASKEGDLSVEFNNILENKTGVLSDVTYSATRARRRGKRKGRFNFFIPPGAEDFMGLMYTFLPKGAQGDKAIEWIRINLSRPFGVAMQNIEKEKAAVMADFKELKQRLPKLPKKAGIFSKSPLKQKILDGDFTMEDAVRVYIWNKQGMTVPNLDKSENDALVEIINKNKVFKDFADNLILINKEEGYIKPDNNWESGNISIDLKQNINTTKRAKHLKKWQDNADKIFTEDNLNKIEALFGRGVRVALEDILRRMKTGRNRKPGNNKYINEMLDWLNDAVGTIMFLNRKSAVLQTISSVNFINWSDNNLLQAGKAFANPRQFWSDFLFLLNSDYLVQRRGGLKINVNESELVEQATKGGARGVISLILSKGFVLTRYADSFAISLGGASFIRNRINTYLKKGLDQKTAEEQAFADFREISEETQQSSRPDRISLQQASDLGRLFLAFANTPMQYARLMKRASQDIINGRGDPRTNWSKLIYYSFVQNFIFNALQQALFALGFGEEEEDEKERDRIIKTAEGMVDSVLRGTGIYGNIVMMAKNVAVDIARRSNKPKPEFAKAAWKLFDVMPPVDRKVTQIRQALYVFDYEMDEVRDAGVSLDNPATMAGARIISATANIPLDQAMRLYEQAKGVVSDETELWQKLALIMGWDAWTLNIEEDNEGLRKLEKGKLEHTKLKKTKLKKQKLK